VRRNTRKKKKEKRKERLLLDLVYSETSYTSGVDQSASRKERKESRKREGEHNACKFRLLHFRPLVSKMTYGGVGRKESKKKKKKNKGLSRMKCTIFLIPRLLPALRSGQRGERGGGGKKKKLKEKERGRSSHHLYLSQQHTVFLLQYIDTMIANSLSRETKGRERKKRRRGKGKEEKQAWPPHSLNPANLVKVNHRKKRLREREEEKRKKPPTVIF